MELYDEIRNIPMVRLLFPYICGLIIGIYIHNAFTPLILWICFGVLILAIIPFLKKNFIQTYAYQWIYGIWLSITLTLLGIIMLDAKHTALSTNNLPDSLSLSSDSSITVIARIATTPVNKKNSVSTQLYIEALYTDSVIVPVDCKTIGYFEKDSLSEQLEFGNKVIIHTEFDSIENSGNPEEFDYKNYMQRRGIFLQTYIRSDRFKHIDHHAGFSLIGLAQKSRQKLLHIYQKYDIKNQEFAVASALTLGYKDHLDEEIKKAYSASGAMHILAVSGLHVGIIYLIINTFLKFITRFRYGEFIRFCIIVLSLVSFALITGLSPSVSRAVLMFTLIALGALLKRATNIYNTIAASAFILLLINPYLITDVGFQLSYSAVTAIVYFQSKIYKLITFRYWLPDKIWALLSVSIAAQLGTFPIGIYYFNQFPNYFWLTNIIVIPLAFIIVFLSVILFSLSAFDAAAQIIAYGFRNTLRILNYLVQQIEALPYSTTTWLSFSLLEVVFIYLILILASIYLVHKQKRFLIYTLATLCILLTINAVNKYNHYQQNKVFVYNVRKSTAINFIHGRRNLLLADMPQNNQNLKYAAQNNWLKIKAGSPQILPVSLFDSTLNYSSIAHKISDYNLVIQNSFIKFHNTTFLILRRKNNFAEYIPKQKLKVDYIILTGNVFVSLVDLKEKYDFKGIIIDSSNSYSSNRRWMNESSTYSIPCYSVIDNGAFCLSL